LSGRERHDLMRSAKKFRQEEGGVEVALLDGAQHTREDFLRVRTAQRPIAATQFARDDGRSQRLRSAPVGRVNRIGLEQEREDGGKFDGQMRREILHDASAAGVIDQGIEVMLQMTAGNGDPVRRHLGGAKPVTHPQRPLQHALHARRNVRVVLIAD
jgi:hypothetical protein